MAKKKAKDRSGDLISEIQNIHFLYERAYDKFYASLDISNEQINVLEILENAPDEGIALNQIQRLLPNQTSNTTRLVNKLHAKKFLSKKSNPQDKRRLMIAISTDGRTILNNARDQIKPVKKKLKKNLNTVSSKSLISELKTIRKSVQSVLS